MNEVMLVEKTLRFGFTRATISRHGGKWKLVSVEDDDDRTGGLSSDELRQLADYVDGDREPAFPCERDGGS